MTCVSLDVGVVEEFDGGGFGGFPKANGEHDSVFFFKEEHCAVHNVHDLDFSYHSHHSGRPSDEPKNSPLEGFIGVGFDVGSTAASESDVYFKGFH